MSQVAKASLLLFFLTLCGAATFLTHHLREHQAAPAPRELFTVVNDQLAAVRAEDYSSAYRHAASGVQQKFTLPQFETMVRRTYAGMTHARRIEFGSVAVQGSSALVQVYFFDEHGTVRTFIYSLTSEGNGWRIGGVEELSAFRSKRPLAGTHA